MVSQCRDRGQQTCSCQLKIFILLLNPLRFVDVISPVVVWFCCFLVFLVCFLSLLALGSKDAHPEFINIGMSIALYILKTGSLTGSETKNYVKGVAGVIIIPSCRVHGSHLVKFRRGQLLKNIPAVQSEKHEQTKDRIHLCLYFTNNEKPTLCMPFSPTLLFHGNCSIPPAPIQTLTTPAMRCLVPHASPSSPFFPLSQILHAPSLCGAILC